MCEDEVFDPTQYVGAYVRYFVRHPTTQMMPRKIKTSFTGAEPDRAIIGHPRHRLPRPRSATASRASRSASAAARRSCRASRRRCTSSWRPTNGEYLKIAEAVFRIFDRQDWLRVNRARARIKVFVDKFGIDELRKQVEEELKGDWVDERDFTLGQVRLRRGGRRAGPYTPQGSPNGDQREFDRFVQSAVKPQRQEGFSTIHVHVPRGDLTPEQFRGIAQIMRDFTGGHTRTTVHQNFVLRWVRDEALYDVWQRLLELDLGKPGADEITDVVCCPGTDSCKLGITSSMGLNLAIRERLGEMGIDDPLVRKMHIKMSGCPNGCSQHHIADIGFYGASIKVGENTIPAYIAHIGGEFDTGQVAYGARLKVRLAAKRVPGGRRPLDPHVPGGARGRRAVPRLCPPRRQRRRSRRR